MSKIGPKDSKQEIFIRKLVHGLGYRYRLHRKDLPGKPDIVFPKHKKVIFINGCFWHGHKDCNRSKLPETNSQFWKEKIGKNIKNDEVNQKELKKLGWDHLTIWQCDIKQKNIDLSVTPEHRFFTVDKSDQCRFLKISEIINKSKLSVPKIKPLNNHNTNSIFSFYNFVRDRDGYIIIENKENKINTWAIFWYATIFKQNGLCLNPTQTFVENIGHDGSGVHCGESETYSSNLSLNKNIDFIKTLDENNIVFERIQVFYKSQKKSFVVRVINKISRVVIKRNIIK